MSVSNGWKVIGMYGYPLRNETERFTDQGLLEYHSFSENYQLRNCCGGQN